MPVILVICFIVCWFCARLKIRAGAERVAWERNAFYINLLSFVVVSAVAKQHNIYIIVGLAVVLFMSLLADLIDDKRGALAPLIIPESCALVFLIALSII